MGKQIQFPLADIFMTDEQFNKAFSKITSHGWLTYGEAKLLIESAETVEGPILEVGCYQGRATMLLGKLGRPIYCVDPWDDNFLPDMKGDQIFQRFKANVDGLPVIPFRCKVEDWTPLPVEFAYLDGDHSYQGTLNQITKAMECNPDVIAIHDVNDSGGGLQVKKAALEMLGPWNKREERLAVWLVNGS